MIHQKDEPLFQETIHQYLENTPYTDVHFIKNELLWKMLIIDDEDSTHQLTHLLLNDYLYRGKPLIFISAYSSEQAKALLLEHPDIAVILLDVVMETDDAGLQLVRYIRETLNNHFVRIILRTGQPNKAEREEVIVKYDINDYIDKTELTHQKMLTLITTSLRTYVDMMTIESYRQNLENKVIERTRELQQKNEELLTLNRQLLKLDQEKNEFLGITAHDLKNPVFVIQELAQIIQNFFDNSSTPLSQETIKSISRYIQIITVNSQHMSELIVNLLDVNKIENEQFEIYLDQLELPVLVRSILNNYSQRAKAKNINLHFQIPASTCLISADSTAVHQILDNLISNAIKYSPKNKKVTISLIQNEGCVLCTIQDEGPGLSKEEQKKLFNKFTRLSPKPTDGESSTGLGLYIVKRLVEAMKGEVGCESEQGKGTTFFVKFTSEII